MGRLVEDGFVVLKGSLVRAGSVPSAHKYITNKRQSLLTNGVPLAEGKSGRFVEDYLFDTPSGAAMIVLGRSA